MAHATVAEDGDLLLHTAWNEKELAKQVPGARWDPKVDCWRLVPSWASFVVARGVFGQALSLGEDAVDLGWRLREGRVDGANHLRAQLEPDPACDTPVPQGLYKFQHAAVQFMESAGSGLIGDEMGTGKTVEMMGLIYALLTRTDDVGLPTADPFPLLLICPNSLKRHWARHVPRWLPEGQAYVVDGTPTRRRRTLAAAAQDPQAIVVINIESVRLFSRLAPYGSVKLRRCRECDPKYGEEDLKASRCEVHRKELNDIPFRTVILDEAHRVKDPKAQQTRAIWQVGRQPTVTRRWALTGTPIANHPGDLWSVMHFAAPEDFPTRGPFLDRFCLSQSNAFGGTEVIGVRPDTREELFKILDPRFRRVLKAVVLSELPPRVRIARRTQLTPQMRRAYDELDATMQVAVSGGLLVAPNHLVKNTRLMQFACASTHVEKPDPNDVRTWRVELREPSPKLDELELVLDELGVFSRPRRGAPVLVAAQFKQLLRLAARRLEKLGVRHAVIDGDVSEYDRDRALEALNEHRIDVLLFTGQAGGTGLDMSAADVLVNLQRSWSLVDERQKEDRNHRIGSERHEKITVVDIITEGTVEERQVDVLLEKMMRLEEVMRDRVALAASGLDTSHLDALEAEIIRTNLFTAAEAADLEALQLDGEVL